MNKTYFNFPIALLLSTVFISIFFLLYQQIFSGTYESDTPEHIIFIYKYFYGSDPFYLPHPLWHFFVFSLSSFLHISIEYSAILFTAFIFTLLTYIIYIFVRTELNLKNHYILIFITFIIIIIGPLCIPWYDKIIYLGQGSPNIWHNVTLWMVKPFALLSVIFVIKATITNKSCYYLLTLLLLIISLYAKPSFAIMFLPSLLIFAFVKKLFYKKFILFYILLGLVSVSILLYQYSHTFSEGESKVIFDFLGVWSQSSQNIAISIILALAFPMLFTVWESKIIHDNYILFSWIQIFIGILFYAFFAQTGRFYTHGNFAWSYMIAMSLLYIFSIIKFCKIYNDLNIFKRYVLSSLLLLQVIIGIYYFVKVLQGQNPLYIAIFL